MAKDNEIFEKLIGIAPPWFVKEAVLDEKHNHANIYLIHEKSLFPCPICKKEFTIYDHSPSRSWRHLNACKFETYLHAQIPRIDCLKHGKLQIEIPWAEAGCRFTKDMEGFILDSLFNCLNIKGACRIANISWDQGMGIMNRAVARGVARKKKNSSRLICVDEKAVKKGHSYLTIISDLEKGIVLHIEEDRTKASLTRFYDSLDEKALANIKAVSMDMWPAYIGATIEKIDPEKEKITFDRFHVSQMLNKAVDETRREEHRQLLDEGNDVLVGTRYLWLYNPENLPEKYEKDYNSYINSNLNTAKAWGFKEAFRTFFEYKSRGWAKKFFNNWYDQAIQTGIKPLINVANTLERHLYGLLNHAKHQISNGLAEGLNSKIMDVKRRAKGHRNTTNLKTAIIFFCGGLNVYP